MQTNFEIKKNGEFSKKLRVIKNFLITSDGLSQFSQKFQIAIHNFANDAIGFRKEARNFANNAIAFRAYFTTLNNGTSILYITTLKIYLDIFILRFLTQNASFETERYLEDTVTVIDSEHVTSSDNNLSLLHLLHNRGTVYTVVSHFGLNLTL